MSADVIVIGGGVAGCACAAHLAERGLSVLLLERGALASGASGRNQGGLLPSPHPVLRALYREGVGYYQRIAQEADVDFQLRPHGYLLVAAAPTELVTAGQHAEALAEGGFPTESLSPAALVEREPALDPSLAGGFAVDGAYAFHPVLATLALAEVARRRGARIRTGACVRGLVRTGDRVTGVVTDDGVHSAGAVVDAAGPWARSLALQAGVDVPVFGARGWLVRTAPLRQIAFRHTMMQSTWHGTGGIAAQRVPTLAELATDETTASQLKVVFSLQPLPSGELVLGSSTSRSTRDDPERTEATALIARAAARFVPGIGAAPVRATWSGIRPSTPDGLPVFGPAPGAAGLWMATGYGIDGMPLAPATARMLAGHIVDGRPDPGAEPFAADRFTGPG